jgi:hypothetical protein
MRMTDNTDVCRRTYAILRQQPMQLVDALHLFAGKRVDNVALFQSRAARRAVFVHRDHKNSASILQAIMVRDLPKDRHVLACHSYIAAPDPAIADKP